MTKENNHFLCYECGSRFDLNTASGRCSAHYGLCRKCFCEKQIKIYKTGNILHKIAYFIPHIIITLGYRHYYGTK